MREIDVSLTHSHTIAAATCVADIESRPCAARGSDARAALHRGRDARGRGAVPRLPRDHRRADGARRGGGRHRGAPLLPGRPPVRRHLRRRGERRRRPHCGADPPRGGTGRRRDGRPVGSRGRDRCAVRHGVPRRPPARGGGLDRANRRERCSGRSGRPALRRRRLDRRGRRPGRRGRRDGHVSRKQGRAGRVARKVPRREGRRRRHRARARPDRDRARHCLDPRPGPASERARHEVHRRLASRGRGHPGPPAQPSSPRRRRCGQTRATSRWRSPRRASASPRPSSWSRSSAASSGRPPSRPWTPTSDARPPSPSAPGSAGRRRRARWSGHCWSGRLFPWSSTRTASSPSSRSVVQGRSC